MKIGILGAGAAGLVSLKYALEEGHEVVCFEKSARLGGCWSGDGRVGKDELGNHISSGMYKGLTTNLPKEIMIFDGLEHNPHSKSFVGQAEILHYLQTYAKKFNLAKSIRFGHEVISIEPLSSDPNTRWRLLVRNLTKPDEEPTTHDFDALMLAPGHFVHKFIADIKDANVFQGDMLHSNDFRDGANYVNKRVLVIGAGPSGGDIAKRVAQHAKITFQSVKVDSHKFVPIHKDVVEKGEVDHFDRNGAHFQDGSYEPLDVVIYSTGYTYMVPCLSPACGIRIENNWFKFLYHHCINIERPSMAIIGLPYGASIFPLADLQVRYYMAYLAGKFDLPSREAMLESVSNEHAVRISKGVPDRNFHNFSDCGRALSGALAKESGVRPTPNVIFNIMDALHGAWNDQDKFEIVDDETFNRTPPGNIN
ncbi:flavin-containing monooxygenase 3-like [Atheta coriaria]|uniref:flavin-containing monooxygenase 3-like n=1 Tax=Dalotia coriaria TaxID=877792 RepID=UPI0031F386DB